MRDMRAISVQQPWAHFMALNIQRIVVRRGSTSYTGRIALHASTEIALKEVERLWNSNVRIARRFAEQGFIDRDDIKALPRGAIIGTIELVGVERGSDVHEGGATHIMESGFARALDTAVRSRSTGKQRPLIIRSKTLPVPIPDDQHAWAFKGAVDFEPILGVEGKQNLWRLSSGLERQVAEAEAWSTRFDWHPPAVDKKRLKRAMAAFKARWSESVKTSTRGIVRVVMQEIQRELLTIDDPAAEAWVQDAMQIFFEHGCDRDGNVRVPSGLGRYFGGRTAVSPLEFELECRSQLHAQLDRMKWDARRKVFEEDVLAFHSMLLAKAERRPISNAEIVRRVREHCRETFLRHQQELDVRIEWVVGGAAKEEGVAAW